MLLESLIVAAAVLSLFRNLILTWANVNRFPKSIPWIGRRNEYFSRIRACGREIFGGLKNMKAGYEEVSASPHVVIICDRSAPPSIPNKEHASCYRILDSIPK